MALIFPLIPTTDLSFRGLITTSLDSDRADAAPDFNKWFRPTKFNISEEGDFLGKGKKPTAIDPNSDQIVKANTQNAMTSYGDGSGSMPGKRLVMRVKSPVKLYWLAHLLPLGRWLCSSS